MQLLSFFVQRWSLLLKNIVTFVPNWSRFQHLWQNNWPPKHMMMHWFCSGSYKRKLHFLDRMNECVTSFKGVGMININSVRMSSLLHHNYYIPHIIFQLHICVREMAIELNYETTFYYVIQKSKNTNIFADARIAT